MKVRDFQLPKSWWDEKKLDPSVYSSTIPVMTVGCICPAGANKDCENPICPRKAPK